jgi:anti-anti-sigma regulatory factor
MNIQFQNLNKGLMVSLYGILFESGNADVFARAVREAMPTGLKYLVFNFNESSLPDSRFISKMIELYHENKRNGVAIYLICGKNEDVADLFKVNFLDKIMPIITSTEQLS